MGGVLSPLLANIALSVIEERYTRYVWPRQQPTRLYDEAEIKRRARRNRAQDKSKGQPVFVPVRYADDFIILVSAPPGPDQQERAREFAELEKAELSQLLKETLKLKLSETKTLVTPVTEPIRFLGYHFRVQRHPVCGWVSKIVIPKKRSRKLRESIKLVFKRPTVGQALESRPKKLNPIIRGWGYFYRHAWGGKDVFSELDNHVWHTVWRWLRKKHPKTSMRKLVKRYGRRVSEGRSIKWQDGKVSPFELSSIPVLRYRFSWQRPPAFCGNIYGEPGA